MGASAQTPRQEPRQISSIIDGSMLTTIRQQSNAFQSAMHRCPLLKSGEDRIRLADIEMIFEGILDAMKEAISKELSAVIAAPGNEEQVTPLDYFLNEVRKNHLKPRCGINGLLRNCR